MNRYAQCSECGQTYQVTSHAEKKDPGRVCIRCYVEKHEQPLDFLNSLRGQNGRTGSAHSPAAESAFPAASAAGSSIAPKE